MKYLSDILEEHEVSDGSWVECDREGIRLQDKLLEWASDYGERIRNTVRDLAIGLDGPSYVTDRMRDEKLPRPA